MPPAATQSRPGTRDLSNPGAQRVVPPKTEEIKIGDLQKVLLMVFLYVCVCTWIVCFAGRRPSVVILSFFFFRLHFNTVSQNIGRHRAKTLGSGRRRRIDVAQGPSSAAKPARSRRRRASVAGGRALGVLTLPVLSSGLLVPSLQSQIGE